MLRCFTLPAYRTLKEEDADVQGPVRVAVAIDRTSGGRTLGKKGASSIQSNGGATKSPPKSGGRRRGDHQTGQQQSSQPLNNQQQQQQRSLLSSGVVSEGGVLRRARTGAGASGTAQGPGAGPAPSFVRHLEANLRRKEDPALLLHQGSSSSAAGDDAALLADGAERYTRLPQGSTCVSSSPPQCQAPPTPASPAAPNPASRTSSNGPTAVISSSSASPPAPSNLAAPSPPPHQPEASRSPTPRGRTTTRMATAASSWSQIGGGGPSRAPPPQQPHPPPSGFVSRPARGWLHTDQQVLGPGVTYAVRYVGCLDVKMSMKSLDFDTRSLIAKECITRVCEAAGLRPVDKKRKVDRRLQRMLADRPNLDYAGSNVTLCVTSSNLTLAVKESGQVIADHSMPNISFASAGDTETLDFVAYVAKDGQNARACFVLECSGGVLAQDVISTIGHAFELRFREFMRTAPPPGLPPKRPETVAPSKDDPDYYNDLPGKIPPEAPPPPVPPLPDYRTDPTADDSMDTSREALTSAPVSIPPQPNARKISRDTNLIDLSGEELPPVPIVQRHEYVNMGQDAGLGKNGILDPFDMPPVAPPQSGVAQEEAWHRATLEREVWFHGAISRKEGESRLAHDGDFLVRESHNSPGQFVLTGMQNGARRHLLLVDPAGVVRTKDRTFDSVSHLVNFHRDNALPIISAESALVLKTPVPRPR